MNYMRVFQIDKRNFIIEINELFSTDVITFKVKKQVKDILDNIAKRYFTNRSTIIRLALYKYLTEIEGLDKNYIMGLLGLKPIELKLLDGGLGSIVHGYAEAIKKADEINQYVNKTTSETQSKTH